MSELEVSRDEPHDVGVLAVSRDPDGPKCGRFAVFAAGLTVLFSIPLLGLILHAFGNDLHSHILLIPFVSAYLVHLKRQELPGVSAPSWAGAVGFAVLGVGALALVPFLGRGALSPNDYLAAMTAAYLCFLVAGGFALLGGSLMKALAFPIGFLVFMIPLPDGVAVAFEDALVLASADVTNVFFKLADLPFLRIDRVTFELPHIKAITVARECSGIRSSWVLLITSLLASYLFLQSPWRRGVLVALVIPLGVIRNAFRILVIALLCVHVDPSEIDGPVHKHGGPFFFALSLVPLFVALWWFRRQEGRRKEAGEDSKPLMGADGS